MITQVEKIRKKFDDGQQIFRRVSVEILLARIQQLEIQAAQQKDALDGAKATVHEHNFENGLHCMFENQCKVSIGDTVTA